METHCCEFYFGCLKSLSLWDKKIMFAGTQRKGGGVCVQRRSGAGWLSMVLFVLFFSVRGKTAELRKSFTVAREESGSRASRRSPENAGPVALPALRKGPPWNAIPTCVVPPDPYKAPTGPRRLSHRDNQADRKSEGPP